MNRKEFIAVFVITCFVILVWLIAEIVHTQPSNPIDPKIQQLLDPLNPNFDQKTLQQVSQVRHLEPSQQSEPPREATDSPSQDSASEISLPSPSPSQPAAQTSTDSAQLQ
jgi:hypothetical protein